jgi:hypothetical protein
MDDTFEKSYFYHTNSDPGPDPESHDPRQTNYDEQSTSSQHRHWRHRLGNLKEKEDNNDSIIEYGEEQEIRALYQPMCVWN